MPNVLPPEGVNFYASTEPAGGYPPPDAVDGWPVDPIVPVPADTPITAPRALLAPPFQPDHDLIGSMEHKHDHNGTAAPHSHPRPWIEKQMAAQEWQSWVTPHISPRPTDPHLAKLHDERLAEMERQQRAAAEIARAKAEADSIAPELTVARSLDPGPAEWYRYCTVEADDLSLCSRLPREEVLKMLYEGWKRAEARWDDTSIPIDYDG